MTATGTATPRRNEILPLASQAMYCIWHRSTALEGKLYSAGAWSGTTDAIATITSTVKRDFSAIVDSSFYIFCNYISSTGTLVCKERTASWQAANTVDSTTTCYHAALSYDVSAGLLQTFYTRALTATNIYYSSSTDGVTWTSPASIQGSLTSATDIGCCYHRSGAQVIYVWSSGAGSPYPVNANYQAVPELNLFMGVIVVVPVVIVSRRLKRHI